LNNTFIDINTYTAAIFLIKSQFAWFCFNKLIIFILVIYVLNIIYWYYNLKLFEL
jgi:hypothetical protein